MALTNDEKQEILDAIKAESNDITELPAVSSLNGIVGLPAMQGQSLVLAPLILLSRPATEAAVRADAASVAANNAAQAANAAAAQATEAAAGMIADVGRLKAQPRSAWLPIVNVIRLGYNESTYIHQGSWNGNGGGGGTTGGSGGTPGVAPGFGEVAGAYSLRSSSIGVAVVIDYYGGATVCWQQDGELWMEWDGRADYVRDAQGHPRMDVVYVYERKPMVSTDGNGMDELSPSEDDLAEVVSDVADVAMDVESLQGRVSALESAQTPSGDPMHWMYVMGGAVWNAATGYWEMNTLTDLTTEDIRRCWLYTGGKPKHSYDFSFCYCRTNFPQSMFKDYTIDFNAWFCNCEVLNLMNQGVALTLETVDGSTYERMTRFNSTCKGFDIYQANNLRRIIGPISLESGKAIPYGRSMPQLEQVFVKNAKENLMCFSQAPKLNAASVAYMIKYASTTTATTITLHATAYARAIADSAVQAQLEAHPLVTLTSA